MCVGSICLLDSTTNSQIGGTMTGAIIIGVALFGVTVFSVYVLCYTLVQTAKKLSEKL